MALNTYTETMDNLFTTTWYHMQAEAIDNIFASFPFWFWMRDKGRLKSTIGGRLIHEALEYGENVVTWIAKGGTTTLADYEHLTVAQYTWKHMVAPIVRFGRDDLENRGAMKIIDLVASKLNNTKKSLAKDLEAKLFAGNASGEEIDGLQWLVKDDPTTTSTIGGIAQATYTWWQNKVKDMAGLSFAAQGVVEMRTMLNNVANNFGNERPDILVSGQTPYEYYEDNVLDYYHITSNKLGDLGFDNIMFKGIPMVWSPSCANTRMYFLNTDFLTLRYDPMANFDMTEWKALPEQVNDRVAQILFACSFTMSNRRAQGVMFGIDTA